MLLTGMPTGFNVLPAYYLSLQTRCNLPFDFFFDPRSCLISKHLRFFYLQFCYWLWVLLTKWNYFLNFFFLLEVVGDQCCARFRRAAKRLSWVHVPESIFFWRGRGFNSTMLRVRRPCENPAEVVLGSRLQEHHSAPTPRAASSCSN